MTLGDFREREPITNLLLYHLFRDFVIVPPFYTYFKGRVYDSKKVPQTKPHIVVSNHASYFDPLIISHSVGRPVAYMAKEELFDIPLLKQWMMLYGAYPVKRETGDRGAIRAAINALQNGWMVGIFLEGTRTPDARISYPKLGAAMIAAKAQVPLLPMSLWGTEKILQSSSVPKSVPLTVRFGELIDPPTSSKRKELESVTQKCATIINSLHDLGR
ncbi:lysophospholipid acyltransferase family protein [Aphanothece sacrum]|uniref:1-acyl-sn-glycerol-3-phosphate acyltransferase n=1 Tax=Aphanothece sacrum FPU1 TaxID=1920663 RepID=A0A401IFI7_APHSA|nr:lysophospholipid acyltransferase family protein [Aphanothece sacrum]GBF79984.1 1-acyl-sn-glycerol-3-phosphate acyltransferase [Aphanothece sacrum FPU1]GBF83796.1 1-acyl-sn-glycerol-3-phosphate acyltransferase [Aphanothece sacrum FPU3]